MEQAVVCEPIRTPVGRYGGVFRDVTAVELGKAVVEALVQRSGVPPAAVDDVIFGQCYPNGEAPALGRVVALDAGLPVEVGGIQLDRRCGSGLQAIIYAAMQVQTGASEVVIAGGAESMSQTDYYSTSLRWQSGASELVLFDRLARARVTAGGQNYPVPGGMLETAENLRREYRISRNEQDELALTSHLRAVRAQVEGRFADEIVPVPVDTRSGRVVIGKDEHPRSDTTLEQLAALRPIRLRVDSEATVTAGNASGQNDGAAACIVTNPARAAEYGLKPIARLVGWAQAGVAPRVMGLGPVAAIRKVLDRASLRFEQMGLIELNEAFAAQVLACVRELGWRDYMDRLNVNGSGISLGHPVGATGARILATVLREGRRRGVKFVLESMCIGGGQGLAAIFEIL